MVKPFIYFMGEIYHRDIIYPMLGSDYPYTSGATGDDSTDCLYSASKSINI